MVYLATDRNFSSGYSAIFGDRKMRDGICCPWCGSVSQEEESCLEKKPWTKCATCDKPYKERCGCGRHFLEHKDKYAIYDREPWKLSCLFLKIDKRVHKFISVIENLKKDAKKYQKMKMKFIKMKKYIKTHACHKCGKALGNRFRQVKENMLICGSCWSDKNA